MNPEIFMAEWKEDLLEPTFLEMDDTTQEEEEEE